MLGNWRHSITIWIPIHTDEIIFICRKKSWRTYLVCIKVCFICNISFKIIGYILEYSTGCNSFVSIHLPLSILYYSEVKMDVSLLLFEMQPSSASLYLECSCFFLPFELLWSIERNFTESEGQTSYLALLGDWDSLSVTETWFCRFPETWRFPHQN